MWRKKLINVTFEHDPMHQHGFNTLIIKLSSAAINQTISYILRLWSDNFTRTISPKIKDLMVKTSKPPPELSLLHEFHTSTIIYSLFQPKLTPSMY